MTCTCIEGYTGKGDERCLKIEPVVDVGCRSDTECDRNLACDNGKCINPCRNNNPCSSSATCRTQNHQPTCECSPGFTGDPYSLCSPTREDECKHDEDCPSNMVCVDNKCSNPCRSNSLCGNNAVCEVLSHSPVCKCLENFAGDPHSSCFKYECKTNEDCPFDKACSSNNCIDPCQNTVCGRNAECSVEYHKAICKCPSGLQGSPYIDCKEVQCRKDNDCAQDEKCDLQRFTCIKLCKNSNVCAANARCEASRHRERCICSSPYTGDGYSFCQKIVVPASKSECNVDEDCQSKLSCISQKCQNPCLLKNPCSTSQECKVVDTLPSRTVACICPPNTYVNGFGNCKRVEIATECQSNNDCPDTDVCDRGTCINACKSRPCGINAKCTARSHSSVCSCFDGFEGNPQTICNLAPLFVEPIREPGCDSNQDCPSHAACRNRKCINPCAESSPCAPSASCKVINHEPECTCPDGFIGSPTTDCRPPKRPECTSDPECPDHLACVNQKCQNPCSRSTCGINAQCRVQRHRAICSCLEGYIGDPYSVCEEPGCKSDFECPNTQACINRECQNPCLFEQCGQNADCSPRNHRATCKCKQGHKGDPYSLCRPYECLSDPECPDHLKCQNEKCVDPCECARNADCDARNHRGICTCVPDFTGDPYGIACEPIPEPVIEEVECNEDRDCPSQNACINEECDNPCTVYTPCAQNAECKVYDTLPLRTMTCTCIEGYTGKGDERCLKIQPVVDVGCISNSECAPTLACRNRECINPCIENNPCSNTAKCQVVNHNAKCICQIGDTGDPYSQCVKISNSECKYDTDCASNEACINDQCVDPCVVNLPCGKDAECETIRHRSVCKCPRGMAGDPHVACYSFECKTNEDCPFDKECKSEKCVDPCIDTQCGTLATCTVEYHKGICKCSSGYQGNPYISCREVECRKSSDCDSTEKCNLKTFKCTPLCGQNNICTKSAICKAENHRERCSCPTPLIGNGYSFCDRPVKPIDKPECLVDSDCSRSEACMSETCKDPCVVESPCHSSQSCRVLESYLLKTVSCECPKGTQVGTNGQCITVQSQNECSIDNDCNQEDMCNEGTCVNACNVERCGLNADCSANFHRSKCSCYPGYLGDPKNACYPSPTEIEPLLSPGCDGDKDCPSYTMCRNRLCINPCAEDSPCAITAICKVIQHKPVCTCPDGFIGSPTTNCQPPPKPECFVDQDCPLTKACIIGKCEDPCSTNTCGINALCRANNHRATCVCVSGYVGDPYTICEEPGCKSDLECLTTQACISRECQNPCLFEQCGQNAQCSPRNHRALCKCKEGHKGDPYTFCRPYECLVNQDCPDQLKCENEKCVDPCQCAKYADCDAKNHRGYCNCIADYTGDPYGIACEPIPEPVVEEGCESDADCFSQQACIDRECQNPCLIYRPCVENAECKVYDTLPLRTMTCACFEGYSGKGDEKCELITEPVVVGCTSDRECSSSLACENGNCVNPCIEDSPCTSTAKCSIRNHKPICTCPLGFTGDPYSLCVPVEDKECSYDDECSSTQSCVENQCIQICNVNNPCSRNALCVMQNHRPICKCPPGTIGDPHNFCHSYECLSNNDCPLDKSCQNKICANPCAKTICGQNAECSVEYHQAICKCPSGYQGSPYISCKLLDCHNDNDCKDDEKCDRKTYTCSKLCTSNNECVIGAKCTARNHLKKCTCSHPLIGDGYSVCIEPPESIKPECQIDSDCSTNLACMNSVCQNPCVINSPCENDQQCVVENTIPIKSVACVCPDGHSVGNDGKCKKVTPQPQCYDSSDCRSSEVCHTGTCITACLVYRCGDNAVCKSFDHSFACECLPNFVGDPHDACLHAPITIEPSLTAGCAIDTDCPSYNACHNRLCIDPCVKNPCVKNAQCRVINHEPVCTCPDGYIGSPQTNCELPPQPECIVDDDCPSDLACISQSCKTPCSSSTCGINAKCNVIRHRAICVCIAGYDGDPYQICEEPGCKSDIECPFDKACISRECQNPCLFDECGINAECSPKSHRAMCKCKKGHKGNPYVQCKPYECLYDPDCPDHLTCRNEKCVDPCQCAKYAECDARNHRGICTCLPDYTGNAYGVACEPIPEPIEVEGCQMDKDCPSQEACIDRECQNPCLSFTPCVQNAECRVYNTLPLRTMTCSCIEGYSGKGDEKCELIIEPVVVGCTTDRECSTSLACRDTECVNPCRKDRPCAETARCEVNRHKSQCTCPPGMTGDPYSICVIIEDHECEQDSDCNGNNACVEHECVDPCIKDRPCGRNAICKTIDHRPVCKCQSGTAGDPHSFCYEYECLRDNDCPLNKACVSQKCADPCLTTDCGIKAKCKAEYHRGICVCEEGLQGSPFIECKEVECRKDRDCKTNEKCDMNTYKCFPLCDFENPCAEGASCLAQSHKEKCVCQPPLLGNGFVLCSPPVKTEEPECRIDDDCPSKHACINRKCQNPCTRRNPCLPSETCLVVDSSPSKSVSCSCREGFYVGKNGDCIEVNGRPECRSHSDCRYNEQCQSGSCIDACRIRPCGINAICVAENHEATCACRIRFSGNPEVACLPISPLVVEALPPGCRSDSECPSYNQCQNNKCVDPCIVNDPCGKDAFCKVNNHVPLCRCPEGFEGDPSIECKPPAPLSIGCAADHDCPIVEACLNTKCVDPCNCGENALCRRINHKAVCFCPSGFSGNPEVSCEKLECTSDDDCSNDKMCHENTCANPCILLNPCAINAECIPSNHVSKCSCPSEMNGDPYTLCINVECSVNEDCNSERACYQDKCIDPCILDNPCAPNALCKTVQHASSCVCTPPLIGNPLVSCVEKEPLPIEVEKECVVDSDCPSQLACLNEYCENPCYSLSPCHTSAMCSVVDSSPFRIMVCTCREGWIPQEDRSCRPIETPNPPGCVQNDECPSKEACVNRMCRNPCNCGGGAECFLSGHRPICQCPEGFIGNPQVECTPVGCSSDDECRSTEACVDASCVNPCLINNPCGAHAKCSPKLHQAQCECDEGFEGDPYTGCSIIGCKSDSECPNKKACRNRDCVDPCLKDNPCAVFADCVSRDHFAQCRCKVGYQGDPYGNCTVIPPPECVEDGDCTTGMACINEKCDNPCEILKPCTEKAICHVIESLPVKPMTCECPDGYVKDEVEGCKTLPPIVSGCERNDDCSETNSCINAICRSPCACGLNANCKIIDHQPVCTCKPGFYGDPEIECTESVCQSDNDCEETHACRNGECTHVCGPDDLPCGGEAECQGVAHQATCYCPAGLTGDPFVTCNIVSCADNSDCPTDKECINKLCVDSCSISNPCGSRSECKVKNHKVDCSCAPGFIGNKGTSCVKVSVTCKVDEDCPSKQSCIEKECLNPCVYNDPCGINAYCSVYDTLPVRTMTCSCIEGYEGDASVECFPVKACPANSGLILDSREECVCPTGYGFTENKEECVPCLKENGFILNNEGKCVCNDARGYEYNPESGKCECPPGERLNNFGICELVPDCEEDPDCPTQKYCERTNGTCSNPCTRDPCGANAFGDPYDHICHCQCIKGYSGDPKLGCVPVIIPPIKTDFPRPEMVVNCLSDGVLVNVDLKDGGNFRGVMYVKGHSKDSSCIKHIDSGGSLKPIDFQVSFGKCGLFHSQGEANFVLVVQKHPKLETYKAQAYRIKCLYDVGETNINVNFNVSMITTAGTVRNDGPPPNCTMKICNENGEDISSANVGEKLMLKVIVSPREIYGGLARSCIARSLDDSKFEEEYAVTDANGCATDPDIFQEWKLDRNTGYLTALFDAFKFPDSINLKFKCIVRICFGQCQPQNCGGRNAFGRRRKRESSHIIDGKVYTGQLREETDVYSNAIETLEASPQNDRLNSASLGSGLGTEGDEEVCVSKIGFIISLVITALLALVAVAIAVSCWLMAYRKRPKTSGPLPHPREFPNPLFSSPEPPIHHLDEPDPDYLH